MLWKQTLSNVQLGGVGWVRAQVQVFASADSWLKLCEAITIDFFGKLKQLLALLRSLLKFCLSLLTSWPILIVDLSVSWHCLSVGGLTTQWIVDPSVNRQILIVDLSVNGWVGVLPSPDCGIDESAIGYLLWEVTCRFAVSFRCKL